MAGVGSGTRLRVLLVDDDPVLLEVLTTVLDLEDLDVVPVSDGQAALDAVAAGAIDLIVLDVGLPEPDGLEICSRLKADPQTRDLPVILLTGRDTEQDRARGLAVGCDAYLTKPFSPIELLEVIRRGRRQDATGGV